MATRTISASAGNPWVQYGPTTQGGAWSDAYRKARLGGMSPQDAAKATAETGFGGGLIGGGGIGGIGGTSGIGGIGGATKTLQEARQYTPFTTSAPAGEYKDLIARYQELLGGGAGSFQSLINLQRKQGLEALRNTAASKGQGFRSGVGQAAAARFLGEFEPRAAAGQAEYLRNLIGGYGTAVAGGRTQQEALLTGLQRAETGPGDLISQQYQRPAFSYYESSPDQGDYRFSY